MDSSNIVTGKRERKPKSPSYYAPEDHREKKVRGVRKGRNTSIPKRNRNEALSVEGINKWHNYKIMVKKALMYLVREEHYLEAHTNEKAMRAVKIKQQETLKIEKRIHTAKQVILSTLYSISKENEHDKQWPQLAEADEDDMVEVGDVLCSKCNEEETEENDILLCDHAGCLRAYHQNCLDPPITMVNFDSSQDWFCWQCECIDDCLDVITEKLDKDDMKDWKTELFPEIANPDQSLNTLSPEDTIMGVLLPEDEEGEEVEEEYEPDPHSDIDEEEFVSDDDRKNKRRAQTDSEGEGEEDDEDEEEEEILGEEGNLVDGELLSDQDEQGDGEEGEDEDEEGGIREEGEEFISDIESDIDEDELAGLLEDADIPYDTTKEEVVEPVYAIKTRLRDRSKMKPVEIVFAEGKTDIGKSIARVQRGVFVLGTVTGFGYENETKNKMDAEAAETAAEKDKDIVPNESSSSSSSLPDEESLLATKEDTPVLSRKLEDGIWTVSYNDGLETTYNLPQIKDAISMYRDYSGRLNTQTVGLQDQIKDLIAERGIIQESNIVEHKRSHKSIDYATLSLQMFGTLHDEDDLLDEEDEDFTGTDDRDGDGNREKKKKHAPDEEYQEDNISHRGRKRRKSSRIIDDNTLLQQEDDEEGEEGMEMSDFEEKDDKKSKQKKKQKDSAEKKTPGKRIRKRKVSSDDEKEGESGQDDGKERTTTKPRAPRVPKEESEKVPKKRGRKPKVVMDEEVAVTTSPSMTTASSPLVTSDPIFTTTTATEQSE